MTDWTGGYLADIAYTYGYYAELNPLRLRLALLNAGLVYPAVGAACELGFGQGVTVNIHAAASTTAWHGTDFNAAHAGFARDLARASGATAHLYDEAFADFAHRTDLPDFDFIALHGIWSWVSDENRAVLVDFIRRKLRVGGVLYISYNTLPGWAATIPLRHLLTEHAEVMGAPGRGILSRAAAAIDFAGKLLTSDPLYARANPHIAERLKQMKEKDPSYVAQEYFNGHWTPMHFADMAQWLAPAKLDYACSAHYPDFLDSANLTDAQQAFLRDIPDRHFRESIRDFMVNQQFRRDYWVKGARRLSSLAQGELLRQQTLLLATPRDKVTFKAKGIVGETRLDEAVYGLILDRLADHRPCSIGQIEQDCGVNVRNVLSGLLLLAGQGVLVAVQDAATTAAARPAAQRLNRNLMRLARGSRDVTVLASPVTGAGVAMDRFQQLFLLAQSEGQRQPAEWAQFVWQILCTQNQKLVKDGKTLESVEDNLAELTAQATTFAAHQMPNLTALQVV